jgi:peptidoglycan/LPS O-acetylase OafA/YrhL
MPDPTFSGRPQLTADKLRIVRYSMLVLLLGIGAFAYYKPQPGDGANLGALRLVGFAMCAGALVAIAVMRGLRAKAQPAARPSFGLIGSAVSEGAALFGAVYMLLGGDPLPYGIGMLIFLASWLLLPADPEAT